MRASEAKLEEIAKRRELRRHTSAALVVHASLLKTRATADAPLHRVVLESATVRASAVSALAKF